MKGVLEPCPECQLRYSHSDSCEFLSRKTLSEAELKHWEAGFWRGDGDPAAGDRMLRKYWAHLADDVPSLLKDPKLKAPETIGADMSKINAIRLGVGLPPIEGGSG